MFVRMNVSIAGLDFSYAPKQVVDLPDDLAKAWLECGHASPVATEPVDAARTEPERPKRKGR